MFTDMAVNRPVLRAGRTTVRLKADTTDTRNADTRIPVVSGFSRTVVRSRYVESARAGFQPALAALPRGWCRRRIGDEHSNHAVLARRQQELAVPRLAQVQVGARRRAPVRRLDQLAERHIR